LVYEATDIYTRKPRSVKGKSPCGALQATPADGVRQFDGSSVRRRRRGSRLDPRHQALGTQALPYGNLTCGNCRAAAGTSKNGCSRKPRSPAMRFPGNRRTATLYT